MGSTFLCYVLSCCFVTTVLRQSEYCGFLTLSFWFRIALAARGLLGFYMNLGFVFLFMWALSLELWKLQWICRVFLLIWPFNNIKSPYHRKVCLNLFCHFFQGFIIFIVEFFFFSFPWVRFLNVAIHFFSVSPLRRELLCGSFLGMSTIGVGLSSVSFPLW